MISDHHFTPSAIDAGMEPADFCCAGIGGGELCSKPRGEHQKPPVTDLRLGAHEWDAPNHTAARADHAHRRLDDLMWLLVAKGILTEAERRELREYADE